MSKHIVLRYPEESRRVAQVSSEFKSSDVNVPGYILKRLYEHRYIDRLGHDKHNVTLWTISKMQQQELQRKLDELDGRGV